MSAPGSQNFTGNTSVHIPRRQRSVDQAHRPHSRTLSKRAAGQHDCAGPDLRILSQYDLATHLIQTVIRYTRPARDKLAIKFIADCINMNIGGYTRKRFENDVSPFACVQARVCANMYVIPYGNVSDQDAEIIDPYITP